MGIHIVSHCVHTCGSAPSSSLNRLIVQLYPLSNCRRLHAALRHQQAGCTTSRLPNSVCKRYNVKFKFYRS